MRRRAVVLLVLLWSARSLVGCGSPDVLQSLPRADQARWQRCLTPIRKAQGCNDSAADSEAGLGAMLLDERCLSKKAPKAEYARTAEAQRPRWLRDHGCPEGDTLRPPTAR